MKDILTYPSYGVAVQLKSGPNIAMIICLCKSIYKGRTDIPWPGYRVAVQLKNGPNIAMIICPRRDLHLSTKRWLDWNFKVFRSFMFFIVLLLEVDFVSSTINSPLVFVCYLGML